MPLSLYTSDVPTKQSNLTSKSHVSNPTLLQNKNLHLLLQLFTILSWFSLSTCVIEHCQFLPFLQFFLDSNMIPSQFSLSTCVLEHCVPIFMIPLWFTHGSLTIHLKQPYNLPVYLPKICILSNSSLISL